MARKRLKMTKACIQARRRYRQKKKTGSGCACKKGGKLWVPPKWAGIKGKKKKWTKQKYGLKKGSGIKIKRRRRRRRNARGEGFFDDVGSFISNAAQTVLPLLPMLL